MCIVYGFSFPGDLIIGNINFHYLDYVYYMYDVYN